MTASERVAQWRRDNPEKAALLRQRQNRRYREKCRALIRELKAGRPCVDCGQIRDKMDFDHRDDEIKLFSIARFEGRSLTAIRAEAAKCDIRCAGCHAIRHNLVRSPLRERDVLGRFA